MLEEDPELLRVVAANQLPCRPTPFLRILDLADANVVAHPRQPTRLRLGSGPFGGRLADPNFVPNLVPNSAILICANCTESP